jgi:hypothetical protein
MECAGNWLRTDFNGCTVLSNIKALSCAIMRLEEEFSMKGLIFEMV